MRTPRRVTVTTAAGFSLIEIMIVVIVIGILVAIAAISLRNYQRLAEADTAASQITQLIRQTRENALSERVTYRLRLMKNSATTSEGDQYVLERYESGANAPTRTVNYRLPKGWLFGKLVEGGVPVPASDPRGLAEVTYVSNISDILFKGDGLLGDGNGVAGPTTNINIRPLNNTIFIYDSLEPNPKIRPFKPRAITVFGVSGRTNIWKLYKTGATYTWSFPGQN